MEKQPGPKTANSQKSNVTEAPRSIALTELSYGSYLKIDELLSLQKPESSPPHHDEMLFIVIHQAYELWFKLILHELEQTKRQLIAKEWLEARHFVVRCVEIFRILVPQIHILETMRPADFLQFRDRLNPASGFQSLQYREVEFFLGLKDEAYLRFFKNRPEMVAVLEKRIAEPSLGDIFFNAFKSYMKIEANDADTEEKTVLESLRTIYENPKASFDLYLLCESLVELDEYLGLWREHHVRVVERVIGRKRGTGGSSGVDYLRSTLTKRAFPILWEVRTMIDRPKVTSV